MAGQPSTGTSSIVSRRPRRRPGENRERLIAAGIHEFGRRGYQGASTASIGVLAQVSQPHIYANFRTKQDLFVACVQRACDQLLSDDTLDVDAEVSLHRLLFQAVASVDEIATDSMRSHVLEVRSSLGVAGFTRALNNAAESLLS